MHIYILDLQRSFVLILYPGERKRERERKKERKEKEGETENEKKI